MPEKRQICADSNMGQHNVKPGPSCVLSVTVLMVYRDLFRSVGARSKTSKHNSVKIMSKFRKSFWNPDIVNCSKFGN